VSESSRRLLPVLLSAAIALLPGATQAQQRTMRLAAAADLQPVLPPVLAQFEQRTGIHVEASYQSSATLATEIANGAPYDLFMAADLSFPQRVIAGGRGESAQPIPYARGALVLWTRNDSGVARLSLDGLRDASVHTIAIANPQHAPYGRAAQQTLDHTGLTAAVKSRLVVAENIAQTAQYAESGNAQVGFLSLTSASTPRLRAEGHFLRVPQEDYQPLVQGAVVIKNAPQAAAAHQFLHFLTEPKIRATLAADGLEPPPASQESAH
jgi:molybdate transport system substrate-binding protein